MTFDDLSIRVSKKPTREVTSSVEDEDARKIAGWLRDALAANVNTPYSSQPIRHILSAFNAVAESREFGGH